MALHCIVYSQHQNVPHLTKISLRIKNYSHLTFDKGFVSNKNAIFFAAKTKKPQQKERNLGAKLKKCNLAKKNNPQLS